MKRIASILALFSILFCFTSCGWDVTDPNEKGNENPNEKPDPVTPNDFPEVSGSEISVTITSPGVPEQAEGVTSADEQIHVTGYGCEGNMYFKWKRGDVLYAVNQRTGEVSEIVTQEDDKITALFTGYTHRGVQKNDTYLIYNKDALSPSASDKSLAMGNLRFQTGLPEELMKYAAMGGTANAIAYDKDKGVSLSETTLNHMMAFLHIRALVDAKDKDENFAAMSLFAETTTNNDAMKAAGAACINKHYNIQLNNNQVDIYTDESKDYESYIRCTFPTKRNCRTCTPEMIADDSRASGKYFIDCFMAINPKNRYIDYNNFQIPVSDYIINTYMCDELIYSKHIHLADVLKRLESGKIICINVDMIDPTNTGRTSAITVPGFHFSLSPGYVCGHRTSIYEPWKYDFTGMWEDVDLSVKGINQGIIRSAKGMNELYNEFFVWGGTVPEDLFYNWSNAYSSSTHNFNNIYQNNYIDVATLCDDGYWRTFNRNELDVIAVSLEKNTSENQSCIGYYRSKEIDPITKAQKTYTIYGLYIGTSIQPSYENQDNYFFFPSCIDIAQAAKGKGTNFTVKYNTENGVENRTFAVGTPAAIKRYSTTHNCNNMPVVPKFQEIDGHNLVGNNIFVSLWSGVEGEDYETNATTAYRITFDGVTINIGNQSKGYARCIRGVRY